MLENVVSTSKLLSNFQGYCRTLNDVLQTQKVHEEFYISESECDQWRYLKGSKKVPKISKSGHEYLYSEGPLCFPDSTKKPSRTIITSEGGKSPSRTKHVIETKYGYRRLTPIELERLNEFPDNHTNISKISNSKRAFLLGNSLIVGVIEKIGTYLIQ